jgi:hypothetical protein
MPPSLGLSPIIGILLALFGASGLFGQLQNALNTDLGRKSNSWGRNSGIYPLSFSLLRHGGRCFVFAARSLVLESLLKSFSHYVQAIVPGGIVIALVVYSIFDLCPIFALSSNFCPT